MSPPHNPLSDKYREQREDEKVKSGYCPCPMAIVHGLSWQSDKMGACNRAAAAVVGVVNVGGT
jgi:hypothetical protein